MIFFLFKNRFLLFPLSILVSERHEMPRLLRGSKQQTERFPRKDGRGVSVGYL
jgi:hypothetical protein